MESGDAANLKRSPHHLRRVAVKSLASGRGNSGRMLSAGVDMKKKKSKIVWNPFLSP